LVASVVHEPEPVRSWTVAVNPLGRAVVAYVTVNVVAAVPVAGAALTGTLTVPVMKGWIEQ